MKYLKIFALLLSINTLYGGDFNISATSLVSPYSLDIGRGEGFRFDISYDINNYLTVEVFFLRFNSFLRTWPDNSYYFLGDQKSNSYGCNLSYNFRMGLINQFIGIGYGLSDFYERSLNDENHKSYNSFYHHNIEEDLIGVFPFLLYGFKLNLIKNVSLKSILYYNFWFLKYERTYEWYGRFDPPIENLKTDTEVHTQMIRYFIFSLGLSINL